MFPIRRLAATGAGLASSTSRSPKPRSIPGFSSSVLTEKPSHRRRVSIAIIRVHSRARAYSATRCLNLTVPGQGCFGVVRRATA